MTKNQQFLCVHKLSDRLQKKINYASNDRSKEYDIILSKWFMVVIAAVRPAKDVFLSVKIVCYSIAQNAIHKFHYGEKCLCRVDIYAHTLHVF